MGRRKIEINPILDNRNRSVTFMKRKAGLFKKAYELSILCQVDLTVIIKGSNDKFYEFSSMDTNDLIAQYQSGGAVKDEEKEPSSYGRHEKKQRVFSDRSGNSRITHHSRSSADDHSFDDEEDEDDEEEDSTINNDNELPSRKRLRSSNASSIPTRSTRSQSSQYSPVSNGSQMSGTASHPVNNSMGSSQRLPFVHPMTSPVMQGNMTTNSGAQNNDYSNTPSLRPVLRVTIPQEADEQKGTKADQDNGTRESVPRDQGSGQSNGNGNGNNIPPSRLPMLKYSQPSLSALYKSNTPSSLSRMFPHHHSMSTVPPETSSKTPTEESDNSARSTPVSGGTSFFMIPQQGGSPTNNISGGLLPYNSNVRSNSLTNAKNMETQTPGSGLPSKYVNDLFPSPSTYFSNDYNITFGTGNTPLAPSTAQSFQPSANTGNNTTNPNPNRSPSEPKRLHIQTNIPTSTSSRSGSLNNGVLLPSPSQLLDRNGLHDSRFPSSVTKKS
ncbi:BA75_03226T0 [Komagataella pastoris]|uniref:BA75_03226T0 n=1 Tax=Komagataella pastoris TaxID=4922 RepID=A0A1B2JC24_PICPA|nr:BA75_03226T0 [Komagataella pastoris]